jgi:DNA-binding transcriptional LysR family regulator
VAVVRVGSFADGGRDLGYTGSAVFQQVSAVERELGLKLFKRDAHSIRPTMTAT